MHLSYVHLNFPDTKSKPTSINHGKNENLKISIVQRNVNQYRENNLHFVNDGFSSELKWWQNPEDLNRYIGQLNPDMIYIFGLHLPLHFRWLKHHISSETLLIGQHCGEDIWIQKNLWLQQSALRVVDAFVFPKKETAKNWLKSAAILESQPIFEIDYFNNNILGIYKNIKNNNE